MKVNRGTPTFGIVLGILFMGIGLLWMVLGFWKTLLLLALFAAGYFVGGVSNKSKFVKDAVNRVIPEKKPTPIDIRETIAREQESILQAQEKADGESKTEEEE